MTQWRADMSQWGWWEAIFLGAITQWREMRSTVPVSGEAMEGGDDAMGVVRSTCPGSGDAMEGGDDALGVAGSTFPGIGDAMEGVISTFLGSGDEMEGCEKHFPWARGAMEGGHAKMGVDFAKSLK